MARDIMRLGRFLCKWMVIFIAVVAVWNMTRGNIAGLILCIWGAITLLAGRAMIRVEGE